MDRRTFVVSAVGLAVAGPGVRTARAARTPPLLQLRVERKVTSADCMRGYLLTRVSGEAKWTAACYVLELPDRDNVGWFTVPAACACSLRSR